MSEDKSKLQLIGEIAQANNKNLELIEELNDREDEIERLENIIKEMREFIESYNLPKDLGHLGEAPISIRELRDILEILDKGE